MLPAVDERQSQKFKGCDWKKVTGLIVVWAEFDVWIANYCPTLKVKFSSFVSQEKRDVNLNKLEKSGK